MEYIKLSKLHKLENNPRTIDDADFAKLCTSIADNPDFFEARPLLASDRTGKLVIIGGNQRYDAAKHLGLDKVPVHVFKGLTEAREKEITIRDNVQSGQWDMEALQTWGDVDILREWGVAVPDFSPEPDYSMLGDDDDMGELGDQMGDMQAGVKKAIQIEFEAEDYETAAALVKFWREQDAYIGAMIIEKLKDEKDKLEG